MLDVYCRNRENHLSISQISFFTPVRRTGRPWSFTVTLLEKNHGKFSDVWHWQSTPEKCLNGFRMTKVSIQRLWKGGATRKGSGILNHAYSSFSSKLYTKASIIKQDNKCSHAPPRSFSLVTTSYSPRLLSEATKLARGHQICSLSKMTRSHSVLCRIHLSCSSNQNCQVDEWHIASTCHSPTPILSSGVFLDYCGPDSKLLDELHMLFWILCIHPPENPFTTWASPMCRSPRCPFYDVGFSFSFAEWFVRQELMLADRAASKGVVDEGFTACGWIWQEPYERGTSTRLPSRFF